MVAEDSQFRLDEVVAMGVEAANLEFHTVLNFEVINNNFITYCRISC